MKYFKKISNEIKMIEWLPIKEVPKKTLTMFAILIIFISLLGSISLLLQDVFNNILTL